MTIAQQEGVLALWRGLWPAVFANVPFSALHLLLYRRFKEAVAGARAPPSTALNFGAGGAASLIATLATHPFDVAHARDAVRLQRRRAPPARDLVSAGRAAVPLLKRPLQTALLWTLYEEL